MTFLAVLLPLAAAIGLAVVVTASHRRLPPIVATRAIVVAIFFLAFAAVPTLWIVSLGYVAHLPVFGGRLDWCADALGVHDQIPAWIGVSALLLTVLGLVRTFAVIRSYWQLRHDDSGTVEIADHAQPFAFTLPGRGGHVVLSSSLIAMLDEAEQEVVLAHENAHARERHDRYLLIAQVSAAVVPPLRVLAGRLRFSLERCADEFAVAHCGDRGFVARTLGKVALRTGAPAGAMSFSGLGVPARVAALLAPPATALRSSVHAALWTAVTLTGALALFQIHHIAVLIAALCEG
ncbi:MAG: M56 family metallopeptidase [Ilumatobacteraceae bacterium]